MPLNFTPDPAPTKQCSKCKEFLPATTEHFHRGMQKYGLKSACKKCRSIRPGGWIAPVQEGNLRCHVCLEEFPATTNFFGLAKKQTRGFQTWCKLCRSEYYATNKETITERGRQHYLANRERLIEYQRVYREANKKTVAERARRYRQENQVAIAEKKRRYFEQNRAKSYKTWRAWHAKNTERVAGYKRKHYELNKDEFKERVRGWRRKNKGRVAGYGRKWRLQNPDAARAIKNRRRAREHSAEGTHTAADITRQHKCQKGRCHWCGVKVGKKYHVDHVVPLSRGGSNDPANLVISCHSCNESKGAKLPHEWPQGNRLL